MRAQALVDKAAAGDRTAAPSTWRAAREAMRDFDPVWAAEVRRKIDA